MPGKVNPVISEATMMVAAQVIGNDATVAFAGSQGNFELNVMMPVMARNLLESVRLLGAVSRLLADKVVDGMEADEERAREYAESSPSVVTPLNRYIATRRRPRSRSSRSRSARRSARSWWSGGTCATGSSPRSSSTPRWTCWA
jgi:fumarate hydratase class II